MLARISIGMILGGAIGFGYQRWMGCPTGACLLTRSPWISTLYGMGLGALIASNRF